MATPRLRMGLLGFPAEDYLVALLRTRSALLQWEASAIEDADALWVNGESVALVEHDLVRVPAGRSHPEVLLDLKATARPTAFTQPLADPRVRPQLTFDSRSASSVDRVLRRVESALQPIVMQLALADEMAGRLPELTSETYHLARGGKLVAVINVGGAIGIDVELTPAHVREATWKGLPAAAGEIPSSFFTTTYAEVLWVYVSRIEEDLLPRRYRTSRIYFRAIPRVTQRHIANTHYQVLAALASEPRSFRELHRATSIPKDALVKVLAALYYSASITTDPSRAYREPERSGEGEPHSDLFHALFPAAAQGTSGPSGRAGNGTMPIPLDLRER